MIYRMCIRPAIYDSTNRLRGFRFDLNTLRGSFRQRTVSYPNKSVGDVARDAVNYWLKSCCEQTQPQPRCLTTRVAYIRAKSDEALQVIYKSVVLQKLLYASSAWWHTVSVMRAISPFVIFAVFDVQVLKCCHWQVYKLMFCTFICV